MPIRYISLFSGGFGLDLGMEATGSYELAACIEWVASMRQTIRQNRPDTTIIGDEPGDEDGDLYKLSTATILERAGLAVGEVDLIVGGPPCQTFSILGDRKGFEDPRGSLMLKFATIVREAQPRCFIMENVAGLLTLHKGAALAQIKDLMRNARLSGINDVGYPHIYEWVLDAADFGVPQHRERVFLVGFRADVPNVDRIPRPAATHRPHENARARPHVQRSFLNDLEPPAMIDPLPEHRCVRDVLEDMPDDLPNHEIRIHGDRVRARYEQLAPGQRDRTDHTDRLRWDRPSGTVLVGSSEGGGRPFIHPQEHRHLTVREAARLQAFPDDWVFSGNQTDQYRQVGNAVPPPLACAVARHIAPYLMLHDDAERIVQVGQYQEVV